MSRQLIESYYNSQAILKYKSIKNLINILQNKLVLIYSNVIINISKHISNNKDKIKKTNSDDYIFRRSNENSPKKVVKKAKSKSKKNCKDPKRQINTKIIIIRIYKKPILTNHIAFL